jgi:hypothetical protein
MKRFWPWISIFPALLVILVWHNGGQTRIDIGTLADEQVVRNFHAREHNTLDTYRWSTRDSQLRLPAYQGNRLLGLRGSPAPDETEVTIVLSADHQVTLQPYSGTLFMRNYTIFMPPASPASGWQAVGITANQPPQPMEIRPLGMVIAGVDLASLGGRPSLPPLLPWLILALLPLLWRRFFRLLGLPDSVSLGLSLLLGMLAIGIWNYRPYWIQPFLPIGLATLAVYTGLVWWLRTTLSNPDRALHPTLKIILMFIVFGGLVPLYQYQSYGFFDLGSTLHWHNWPIAAALLALAIVALPPRFRPWAIGALAVLLLGYGLASYSSVFAKDYADDFKVLFRGPRAFIQGDQLYDLAAIRENALSNLYKYPPFFVLIMVGLTGLPFGPAIQLWRVINLLVFLIGAGVLWRWSKRPLRSWSTVGLAYLVLAFQPFVDVLRYGQVDMLVVFAAACALWALSKGRWGLWGALLAFAAAIKLYPAYLVLHAVIHRRWRGVVGFAGAFLGLWAIGIVGLGWGVHSTYLREVLPISGAGTAWVENQTLNGFMNRVITLPPLALVPETSGAVRWLTYAGVLVGTLLTIWRARRITPEAGFGLWLVSMVIILPAAWIHYEVILLIPLYQALVRLEREPLRWSGATLTLYALAWSLLCAGNQWTFFNRTYHGPLWTLLLSYKLYGLMLLWAAIAFDPSASIQPIASAAEAARPTAPGRALLGKLQHPR